MDAKKVASEILSKVGQKENVIGNATCMTRLRLTLADSSKADVPALKDVDSVLGVVETEQGLQIVLGPGKVTEVGREFSALTGIDLGSVDEINAADLAKENKKENKAAHRGPIQRFLEHIANISCHYYQGLLLLG